MQPWATLIALGVKTIETRPAPPKGDMRPDGVRGLPGLAISRGERVAIHAGSRRPSSAPGWTAFHGGSEHYLRPEGRFRYLDQPIPLPLGAVVATAVVADALPIGGED